MSEIYQSTLCSQSENSGKITLTNRRKTRGEIYVYTWRYNYFCKYCNT